MFKRVIHFFQNFTLHFDRSFSKSQVKQIYWLTGIVCIVFGILLLLSLMPGLYNPDPSKEVHGRFFDILFLLFDPGNFTDSMSGIFVLVVALVGIVLFIGCLISVISNILSNRVEQVRNGETWYSLRNHIVIIGFNDSVPSLIHSIYESNAKIHNHESFILIMSEQPAEDIRAAIHVANTVDEEDCIVFTRGQRTALDELEKLSLPYCQAIYLLGEPNEVSHDSINLECISTIATLLPDRQTGLPECHVQFDQQSLFSIFQFCDVQEEVNRRMHFIPYNFCDVWAQKVFVKCEAEDGLVGSDYRIHYRPLDGEEGINKDSNKHVHIIISGMTEMGIALAVQAAHICHFPNFRENDNRTRTHITFVDPQAQTRMYEFMLRFNNMFQLARWRYVKADDYANDSYFKGQRKLYVLDDDLWRDPMTDTDSASPYKHYAPNFIDLQWEFIEADSNMPVLQQYYLDAAKDESAITTFAFCQDNQDEALRTSLYMPLEIYNIAHQILIYQNESPAIVHNLSGFALPEETREALRYHRLNPFGMNTEFHIGDLDSEKYGRLVNVAYGCNPDDGIDKLETLLRNSEYVEKEWNKTSMANKWSSTYCANMRYVKLRFIGCNLDTSSREEIEKAVYDHIEEIKVTEHNRWNVEKLLMGFRPLTLEECDASKDEKKRLRKSSQLAHLDICSYEQLKTIDPGTIIYDASVNMALPIMVDVIRNS